MTEQKQQEEVINDVTDRLTKAEREQTSPNSRPRDAATLIIVDRSQRTSKVLLGRRHDSHKFLPGKFVFPGGRIEATDSKMPAASALHPDVESKLMKLVRRGSPARARAIALAALRETFEETGLAIGVKQDRAAVAPNEHWTEFVKTGIWPDLSSIHFICRAVTPVRRPRRFDARFLAVDATAIAHRLEGVVGPNTELVELVWLPIDEVQKLDMPTITKVALEHLEARAAAGMARDLPVPFYRTRGNTFYRVML
jgi:8-oxo-dGTP pyrophosphatase MutT (NUDIX family)